MREAEAVSRLASRAYFKSSHPTPGRFYLWVVVYSPSANPGIPVYDFYHKCKTAEHGTKAATLRCSGLPQSMRVCDGAVLPEKAAATRHEV